MNFVMRIFASIGFVVVLSGFTPSALPNSSTAASVVAPTFVNMQIRGDGGVYNLARRRFIMITPGYFVKSARIFQTSSGVTLYAFVDEAGLKVYNADNGDHLFELPFYKMPVLNQFNRAHAELEFQAQLSESPDGVEIGVLPARQNRAWRNVAEQPWLKFNLQTHKITAG